MGSDLSVGSRLSAPRFIAFSALFLALAVVLPLGFHALGIGGRVFLPMHFPVLLAGFIAGPIAGLVVGLLAPTLSFFLTGMPPTYAVPLMSLELPLYGLVAGFAYRRFRLNIYIALILAMLVGRLMFALGLLVLGRFMELPYTAAQFFSAGGAIVTGLPGVVAQLIIIPLLVLALKRTRFGADLR